MRKWIDIASERLDEADFQYEFGSEFDCWIDAMGERHMLDRARRQTHQHKAAELFGQNAEAGDMSINYSNQAVDKGWVRIFCHDHRACVELNVAKVTRAAIKATINFVRRTHEIIKVSIEDTGYTLPDEYLEPRAAEKLLGRIMLKKSISGLFDGVMNVDCVLSEKYSRENMYLLRHLNTDGFDYYNYWWVIAKWIEDNDLRDELEERSGQTFENDLSEEEPELFEKLTPEEQKECKEWVVEYLMHNDPADAPSTGYFMPDDKLIHRLTWLIHFSDHASNIWHQGFTHGVDDMDKLGLTTYMHTDKKKYGGYNFAFEANSRYADWAAAEGKYGKSAVMFQNSGVSAWHDGDEEQQIIFWGADVDPRSIVYLSQDYEDWFVHGRDDTELFKGDFKSAVAWVMKNSQQYRGVLHGG